MKIGYVKGFEIKGLETKVPNEQILLEIVEAYGPDTVKRFFEWMGVKPLTFPTDDKNVELLKAQLQQYVSAFEVLKKAAAPYATVVTERSDKYVINFSGKLVECERAGFKARPGNTVKITPDTFQILEVIEDAPTAGEVVPVIRVASDRTCEIERAGSARAVNYDVGSILEEGDRVVLDASGSVIISNLGKPKNDCTFAEQTDVCWDDIGGLGDAKRQLREAVEAPAKYSDVLARYGKKPIKGILLYGPPGCGKTMLGKAAATALAQLHGNEQGAFFYVKGPELLNMYVGNSEQNVRNLFTAARLFKKKHGHNAIIFIDEADAILGKRGSGLTLTNTIVPAFLAEMDGLEDAGALVLLATNRPDVLDPAVIRDGRIDRRIRVARPNRDDAKGIVERKLLQCPLNLELNEALDHLTGELFNKELALYRVKKHTSVGHGLAMTLAHTLNGAMLVGLVDRATSLAMHRELNGGEAGVTAQDLTHAVREAYQQAQDIDHTDELIEFIAGWEHEIAEIHKASGRKVAHPGQN